MNPPNTRNKILCMFSGGIDSTGVLHSLFTDPKYAAYQLIIHHIHLHNRQNRAKAEDAAVKSILSHYRKKYDRAFLYTESVFDTRGFASLKSVRFPYDMDVCAFVGANVTTVRKDIAHVAWGRTKTDINSAGSFEARMQRMQEIFDSVWLIEKEDPPSFIFPVIERSKKEIWTSLSNDVRNMVWWCRVPVYKDNRAIPCGVCGTCMQVKEFENG